MAGKAVRAQPQDGGSPRHLIPLFKILGMLLLVLTIRMRGRESPKARPTVFDVSADAAVMQAERTGPQPITATTT